MANFDGMLQLTVDVEDRDTMLALFPWDRDNTLADGQRAHHVTLGFKPSVEEAERLRGLFADGGWFQPTAVRGDEEIVALFGDLFTAAGELHQRDAHVTLGGTVPPKNSNRLPETGEVIEDGFSGGFRLQLNVVEF